MFSVPQLTARHALFLDFDGTLVDIAAQPDHVRLEAEVARDLQALQQALGGALALVTGRALADIEPHLHPWQPALACEHGAHWREAGAAELRCAPALALQPVVQALQDWAAQYPGLLVEPKRAGVALHYRQAPHLQALCHGTLQQLLEQVPDAELLTGKCVFEIKPAGSDKGRAVQRFLQAPPFAGRVPVFVGDDVTDEAAFAAVQAAGGIGIKVGTGDSQAQARLASPDAVRAWLGDNARRLQSPRLTAASADRSSLAAPHP